MSYITIVLKLLAYVSLISILKFELADIVRIVLNSKTDTPIPGEYNNRCLFIFSNAYVRYSDRIT